MYEETCHIPLIVKPLNKLEVTKYENKFVGTCDFYPTFLDWAGVPEKEIYCDGRSFAPLIDRKTVDDWPDYVVTEGHGLAEILYTQRMIRHGHMKYIFNCGDIDELYDLEQDPYELSNEIENNEYDDILMNMKELLACWMERHNDRALEQFKDLRV